jgi:L-asparaginase
MKSRFRAVLIFATFLITGLLNSTSITAQTSKPELPVVWAIPADNLNAQKSRVLLMLALTLTNDPDRIKRIFSEY